MHLLALYLSLPVRAPGLKEWTRSVSWPDVVQGDKGPFLCMLVFIICVVCLLVVLVKLSLLAKLLARKTPLSSESSPLQFLALA